MNGDEAVKTASSPLRFSDNRITVKHHEDARLWGMVIVGGKCRRLRLGKDIEDC
jgi:hypothetical protein